MSATLTRGKVRSRSTMRALLAFMILGASARAQTTEFASIDPGTGAQWMAGDPGAHTRVAVSGDGTRVVYCYTDGEIGRASCRERV